MLSRPAPATMMVRPASASAIATISPLMIATAAMAPTARTHNSHASRSAILSDGAIIAGQHTPGSARAGA
jgi:hypothetical protein